MSPRLCGRVVMLMIPSVSLLAPCAMHRQQGGDSISAATAATPVHSVTARAAITFDFVHDVPGAPVPKYKVTVRDDGAGSYAGAAAPPRTRYAAAASSAPIPFERDLHLSPVTTAHIFELAGHLDHFNRACASKAKNVADTGMKTISYSGSDGAGSCTYNYTEIKDLAALTELIQGIAQTMDQGRELDRLRRYDRLGLDSSMAFLQQEVAAGRALEIDTIADTLRAIAGDPDVLARVRAKATALLAQAEVTN